MKFSRDIPRHFFARDIREYHKKIRAFFHRHFFARDIT